MSDPLLKPLLSGDRRALARAITLIESTRADHRERADALLAELLPHTGQKGGKSVRLGITGVPGVGKSTFIERFGLSLLERGRSLAVLAIDPSSKRGGGSILGDKTRMEELSRQHAAFIRPSPAGTTLGGVARRTREAMLLVEAAGYDCVLVETMGSGQSETAVADMTDFFLVLVLPGAGDELQGLKKGIVELADMIAINKADGDNIARATAAAAAYRAALHILTPRSSAWSPPVMAYSALTGEGIAQLWQSVLDHRECMTQSGELAARRREQQVKWFWAMLEERMLARVRSDPALKGKLPKLEAAVAEGRVSPALAVEEIAAAIGM